jgi:hypothetical protein
MSEAAEAAAAAARELDWVTTRVLQALVGADAGRSADEAINGVTLTFLLRQYLSTDRADLRDALGAALAQALEDAPAEPTVTGRAAWLTLFVEASAVADDERILTAAEACLGRLRAEWPALNRVDEAAASIDACLRAADLFDPTTVVPDAIDQLERVVGGAYRPGAGVAHTCDGGRADGSAIDQVRASTVLLTAFELTGRLPYSMLAEELMQHVQRDPWDDRDVVVHCEAARVFCRLAALHDDPGYRGAAVIAAGANYRGDAARLVTKLSPHARDASPADAAAYGLALRELFALR